VSDPSSWILNTAIVSDPPLTANNDVCDGLTMTSWSESNGPSANVGVIPRPFAENGEPGRGVKLPSTALENAKMAFP
jgi:hypothetical protein